LNPRKRGLRRYGRSAAALSVAASIAAPALAPAATEAQTAAPAAPAVAAALHVSAQHHVLAGRKASVTGTLSSGRPGVPVVVQTQKGSGWHAVARTSTKAGGRFATAWRPRRPGAYKVQVRAIAPGVAPWRVSGKVAVYHPAMASYYGPGLYGSALACGGTLSPGKLGVANKTLPCGTRVTLRYRGRSVTVPVIDRGPYVAGREYDLTAATKSRLGFGSTGVVWATK
jgi:rare lipoprotein A (peptidoglycan hydrolase)